MDSEKVIKSLKWFRDRDKWREGIMIHDDHAEVRKQICDNAIALLKEHEAVEPYQHDAVWLCGNCEKEVVGWDDDIDGNEYRYPFCRQCGMAVKWK